MRALARFFWELVSTDPWRKLGAIGLALFLWLYVHQRITGEKHFDLKIRPTSFSSWGPDPGYLYVKVPEEKILQVYPPPNDKIEITLRGTNRELAELSGALTAYFDPSDGHEGLKADSIVVAADKIHWDRPQVPGLLKNTNPERITLNFENIERTEIVLKPEQLEIQGTAPDGFAVFREQTQFLPGTVRIAGPKRAIEKLKREESSSLFRPLTVRKDDTSSPQSFLLELAETLTKENLRIESRSALALVPIRPRSVPVKFRARVHAMAIRDGGKSLLDSYRIQGSAEGEDWVEADWIAEVPATLAPEVNESWLQDHARFFLDLGVIRPEEGSSTIEVRHYFDLPASDRSRFSGIVLRPADPTRAKMIVEKRAP